MGKNKLDLEAIKKLVQKHSQDMGKMVEDEKRIMYKSAPCCPCCAGHRLID